MKKVFSRRSSYRSRWLQTTAAAMIAVVIMCSGSGASGVLAHSPDPAQPSTTCPAGGQCFADVPPGNPFYAFVNRIYQQDLVTGYPCGGVVEPCDGQNRPYYRPLNNVTRQQMAKFIDNARHLPGIDIEVSGGTAPIISHNNTGTAIAAYSTSGQALLAQSGNQSAIYAQANEAAVITAFSTGSTNTSTGVYATGYTGVYGGGNIGVEGSGVLTGVLGVSGTDSSAKGVVGASENGYGMYTTSNTGAGLYAQSDSGYAIYSTSSTGTGVRSHSGNHIGLYGDGGLIGVQGDSQDGKGVVGYSNTSDGVYGSSNSGVGVRGFSGGAGNWAGYFEGNVSVTGTCCAMGEAYTRIDDPLDPANKYLNQSLVQSPEMTGIYRGHVTLDAEGSAAVQLPAYFEALNRDFDYQLTPVGAPMPNLYVAQEIQGNSFRIEGGVPGAKVSWQVTGTRNDPYANAHPIQPEQDKPAAEQGKYLHPAEYGQPESAGVNYDPNRQQATTGKP